jgi:hypothetical protein
MPEVADVFRLHGADYLRLYEDRLLPSHRQAIQDILACRTPAMGGHVEADCDHCGHRKVVFHSCKNRHCPKCMGEDTARWLEKQRLELLPVPHFHVVFTLPHDLRRHVRSNQKDLLNALTAAAAQALKRLCLDPRHLGGRIGILSVIHTWTRTLDYHPHVHCLVPAGALSPDGTTWAPAREGFLVPVKALSILFRVEFMARARKALPHIRFPQSLWEKPWVVYCKPAVPGPDQLLEYLGRYLHRTAITNRRIVAVEGGNVTFRYKDSRGKRWRTRTLPALEFIRLFLQHVLPRGFHKVRHYGLLSPKNRTTRRRLALLLHLSAAKTTPPANSDSPITRQKTPKHPVSCPVCKIGRLTPVFVFIPVPPSRPPP